VKPSTKSSISLTLSPSIKGPWKGHWRHGETLFRDDLALLMVDVIDTAKNRKWMKGFKARWKERLEQLEIWMVSYRIDIE